MNIQRVREWEVKRVLEVVGPDTDGQDMNVSWYTNPLQVNAYYSRQENGIGISLIRILYYAKKYQLKLIYPHLHNLHAAIPAGILQTPFYFRGLE